MSSRIRLGWRELFVIFLFWTSLATLSTVNLLLDPRAAFRPISPTGPIILSYIESWLWAALTPLIFWFSSRFSLDRGRWMVHGPLLIVLGIVISIVVFIVLGEARQLFMVRPRRGGSFELFGLRELGRFRYLNQFLVYLAVLVAGYAREYFMRDQQRAREATALQAQLAEARLSALRMQLNPHFLFNTLHAVSALVERDPSGVRKMIARLSELLRLTMDNDAPQRVPLRDELALVQRYIDIMTIRFQGKLKVEKDVAPDVLDALVPNLILQPIVENAFEHGAARATGESVVKIAARRDGDRLLLSVRDNGPGLGPTNASGVGLANTRARLAQLYGERASLTLSSPPEGGALAEIVLPF